MLSRRDRLKEKLQGKRKCFHLCEWDVEFENGKQIELRAHEPLGRILQRTL